MQDGLKIMCMIVPDNSQNRFPTAALPRCFLSLVIVLSCGGALAIQNRLFSQASLHDQHATCLNETLRFHNNQETDC